MKKIILTLVLAFVGYVFAVESTIFAPTADEVTNAVKAVSTNYFYLGSGYAPFRVIKYATADAIRQQHTEYKSELITSVNALALTADASTLYALMNTTENYFAISKIATSSMSLSYMYATLPISRIDKMFVAGQYLCMIGNNTLLRYSLDCAFVDSTPLTAIPFELVDNGVLHLQGDAGIDRLDINTLGKLPTIPVDWKSVGAVTKDSLTKHNENYYIVNTGVEDPTAVGKWKLHTISNDAVSSTTLGTWQGTQPQMVLDSPSNDIVLIGSATNTGDSLDPLTCILNPTQTNLNCYRAVFGATSRNTIFVSASNQYFIAEALLVQSNLLTQQQKYISYSPTTYRSRDNNGMAVVDDQIFFCSSESIFSGLVALNVITGTKRTIDGPCSQITAYGNKVYVNMRSNTTANTIVSIDATTLQKTTIDPEPIPVAVSTDCYRACPNSQIFAVQGVGVFYTSYPTDTLHAQYNKINDDGTVEKVDCASPATPKGVCLDDRYILARDQEYLYAIPDIAYAPPIRKMYRYKVGNDTPIYYERNPAELCDYLPFSLILDPQNTSGKRYGYLACNNVYKFDLLTGVVQEVYLESENFGAKTMAFRGFDLWISGTSASTFKVISNSEITAINWKTDSSIQATTTSSATKSGVAISLLVALLSLLL